MSTLQRLLLSTAVLLSSFLAVIPFQQSSFIKQSGRFIYQIQKNIETARFAAELASRPPATGIPIPVLGVEKRQIVDTFGAPRGSNRHHEGIDIFAPRGTLILSATDGVVKRIGFGSLGGKYVFITGPGGERYYYAHLDEIDPLLKVGQIVTPQTILGTVGTTGNAEGTSPHLHFGIYQRGATNPYDRLANS